MVNIPIYMLMRHRNTYIHWLNHKKRSNYIYEPEVCWEHIYIYDLRWICAYACVALGSCLGAATMAAYCSPWLHTLWVLASHHGCHVCGVEHRPNRIDKTSCVTHRLEAISVAISSSAHFWRPETRNNQQNVAHRMRKLASSAHIC